MDMDNICEMINNLDVMCPIENLDDILESYDKTVLLISNKIKTNVNMSFYHLIQCNYRYINYFRRQLFTNHPKLDYLDIMINTFGQKISKCQQEQRYHDEYLILLYMAYHIDGEIIKLLKQ